MADCNASLGEVLAMMSGPGAVFSDGPTCANCAAWVVVDNGSEWEDGDFCHSCIAEKFDEVRAKLRAAIAAEANGDK